MEDEEAVVDAGHPPETEPSVEPDAWEPLLGKAWTQWPDEPRNLYQNGAQCSLWGRSVSDMDMDQLVLFVGFLDSFVGRALHESATMRAGYGARVAQLEGLLAENGIDVPGPDGEE